jgi:multiple sugar transport system ATP-binding protein
MAEIRVHELHKAFTDFTAVTSSSFAVRNGEFFCLLGPSGCGKTTTLRMIAGLELPTSGQIFLGDEDVSFKRASARDIAFVFQMFALYPHMNVRRNIAFPLVSQGMARDEIGRQVEQAARTLRITHLLDKPVSQLSSGDRQRVALGRAIVRQPKAFLMDEPLGTLDAEFRELMCVELRKLHERLKTTTVFVTHDQNEAMALADHIVVMNKGEILQADDPHGIYNFPSCVFVARFIGRPPMNLLDVRGAVTAGASKVQVDGRPVDVPILEASAERALLGVRPEHVRLVAPDDGLAGKVQRVEYFGSHWIAEVQTDAGSLRALVEKSTRPEEGQRVGLAFDKSRLVLFDAATERLIPSVTTTAHRPSMRHG